MKVLVVAAHPDDEVLGCGATAAKWRKQGHDVRMAVLGEGITSRTPSREEAGPAATAALERLYAASAASARQLGLEPPDQLHLPDNRFDQVDLLDVVKQVEQLLDRHRPDRVLTHHCGDLNIDHRITAQAVLTATRPQPGELVQEVWAFEVPSSTEWAFSTGPLFVPNHFEDVSMQIQYKLKALECYEAEMRPSPHARSLEGVRALAAWRGHSVGCAHAEAFHIIRQVGR